MKWIVKVIMDKSTWIISYIYQQQEQLNYNKTVVLDIPTEIWDCVEPQDNFETPGLANQH